MEYSPEYQLILLTAQPVLDDVTIDQIRRLASTELRWEILIEQANQHGTIPLLWRSLEIAAADLLPASFQTEVKDRCRSIAMRNLMLASELARIWAAFQREEIPVLAFKGPTLAILAYENLALRQFNDIDLLVRTTDYQRAVNSIAALGYRPAKTLTEVQLATYVKQSGQILLVGPNSNLVEIHIKLTSQGFYFPLAFGQLWPNRQTVVVTQRACETFGMEDLLLYLAMHGSNAAWICLGWVVDIGRLMQRFPDLDWLALLQRARDMRIERIFLVALTLSRDLLKTPLPPVLDEACRTNPHVVALAAHRMSKLACLDRTPEAFSDNWFHWWARDCWRDSISVLFVALFAIHESDLKAFHFPRPLTFLYAFARPFRLILKYLQNLFVF